MKEQAKNLKEEAKNLREESKELNKEFSALQIQIESSKNATLQIQQESLPISEHEEIMNTEL